MRLASGVILVKLLEISTPNLADMLFQIPCGNKESVLNGNPYSLGHLKQIISNNSMNSNFNPVIIIG